MGRHVMLEKRVLKQAVSGIVLFFLSASVASGATYYVRTDGNNGNTGTANTSAGAWLTINYAAGHVAAGDTVRVQAGTYVEVAAPAISGTSANTVTLVADGAVTTCGMNFSGKSYIRVIGFTMTPSLGGCSNSSIVNISGTNTGLEFWNDDVGNKAGKGFGTSGSSDRCNKCIVFGGSFHDITNGNTAIQLTGDDTFLGYASLSTICYIGVDPSGTRVRIVNLKISGMIQCNSFHPDFFYIDGAAISTGFSNSVIESVLGIGTVTSTDNKFFHSENQSSVAWNDNIWRFNVAYNMGSGFFSMYNDSAAASQNRWRFYNNTITYCDRAINTSGHNTCGNMSANSNGSTMTGSIVNNLFQQAWADMFTSGIQVWTTGGGTSMTADYNLAFDPNGSVTFSAPWTNQTHAKTNVDPKLNNVSGQDLTLQSSSGARSVGGPLTTASGSGSNSTSLTVAANTGSFFIGSNAGNLPQYGGNLVPGDSITVGSTTVQVSSVSGDTLTLASPISWNNGDPVSFGTSSAVDIGAYPYKAGGYTLSAGYTISGGTATISPSDPSLVRFVVCYSDSVPYAVDNGAPYTCAAPAGTFSARVYPRYASQTLGVTAVLGTGPTPPPSAPTNPRIIR